MPKILISQSLALVLLVGSAALGQPKEPKGPVASGLRGPTQSAADESAIRELVMRYVGSRETGNPKTIAGLFTPDADQLVSTGEWRRGRDALVQGTVASSAREKGQRRTIELQFIRFIGSDVAIADGRYVLSGATSSRNMWTTIIAKRTPQGWRIAAIRNMLPAPPR
ncbi:MAG TPA: SgcJ/EcaC family oxidoreductase [Bryobacteraceae bacterium]|jgi:uncharacterized protein (TIGR02246 family)|nr:SgcJ/EcaC family oxidoreductase [Bryobacteraceae bacterium]